MPAATGVQIDVSARSRGAIRRRESRPLLKRLSKNTCPLVWSCRLASRANGSFRHFMNQLRLCRRERAVATQAMSLRSLDPGSGDRQGLPGLVAKRRPTAADDLVVCPARSDVRVEADEDVEVIVHDGEPADGDGEKLLRKFPPSRSSIHSWRFTGPSLSKKAASDTQRVTASDTNGLRKTRPGLIHL